MIQIYLIDRREYASHLPQKATHFLNKIQQQRILNYKWPKDRFRACCDKIMLHFILCRSLNRDPKKSLDIRYNKYGKPELPNSNLEFSISHSGNYFSVAIAEDRIGVDIEQYYRRRNYLELASSAFHQRELHWLNSLPPHLLEKNFLLLWTLKEAHLKRLSKGLYDGINRVIIPTANSKVLISAEKQPCRYYSTRLKDFHLSIACSDDYQVPSMTACSLDRKLELKDKILSLKWSCFQTSSLSIAAP